MTETTNVIVLYFGKEEEYEMALLELESLMDSDTNHGRIKELVDAIIEYESNSPHDITEIEHHCTECKQTSKTKPEQGEWGHMCWAKTQDGKKIDECEAFIAAVPASAQQ